MCEYCNGTTFIILWKDWYEYVFDCICRIKHRYGDMPAGFMKGQKHGQKKDYTKTKQDRLKEIY